MDFSRTRREGAPRSPRFAVAFGTLILMCFASAPSARALTVAVHLPAVTLHSMEGVQAEIADARTKLQRDHERPRPHSTDKTQH